MEPGGVGQSQLVPEPFLTIKSPHMTSFFCLNLAHRIRDLIIK